MELSKRKKLAAAIAVGLAGVLFLVSIVVSLVRISNEEKPAQGTVPVPQTEAESQRDPDVYKEEVLANDVPELVKQIGELLRYNGDINNADIDIYYHTDYKNGGREDYNRVYAMSLYCKANNIEIRVSCIPLQKPKSGWDISYIEKKGEKNIVYYAKYEIIPGAALYDFNTGKVIMTYEEQESKKEEESKRKEEESREQEKQEAAKRKEQFIAECKTYSYKEIARMPSDYRNKKAKFTGKVIQVTQEMAGSYKLRVNVTKNSYGYEDTLYVSYLTGTNAPRILEDDIITMYGELKGEKTYTTVLGASVTLPAFTAQYVTIH